MNSSARIAVALGIALLTAGCSAPHPQDGTGRASAAGSAAPPTVPGEVTVATQGGGGYAPALTITHAAVRRDAQGREELTMTVRDDSMAPEHLAFVSSPDAGRVALEAGPDGAPLPTAGVPLPHGQQVTFGSHGPRLVLEEPHGIEPGGTVPFLLEFGVAGLVRLQARVASS